jgi:diketogulonate reductase-like aldo/keto reductase
MFQIASLLALVSLVVAQDINIISPKNGPFKEIPFLGFGTWNLSKNTTEVVASAIEAGYRHFDCATAYNNQKDIGAGIKLGLERTGLKRSALWITSKIWSNRHGDQVKTGIDTNLKELGMKHHSDILAKQQAYTHRSRLHRHDLDAFPNRPNGWEIPIRLCRRKLPDPFLFS